MLIDIYTQRAVVACHRPTVRWQTSESLRSRQSSM